MVVLIQAEVIFCHSELFLSATNLSTLFKLLLHKFIRTPVRGIIDFDKWMLLSGKADENIEIFVLFLHLQIKMSS